MILAAAWRADESKADVGTPALDTRCDGSSEHAHAGAVSACVRVAVDEVSWTEPCRGSAPHSSHRGHSRSIASVSQACMCVVLVLFLAQRDARALRLSSRLQTAGVEDVTEARSRRVGRAISGRARVCPCHVSGDHGHRRSSRWTGAATRAVGHRFVPHRCGDRKSDHMLLHAFKNKADYCRVHAQLWPFSVSSIIVNLFLRCRCG